MAFQFWEPAISTFPPRRNRPSPGAGDVCLSGDWRGRCHSLRTQRSLRSFQPLDKTDDSLRIEVASCRFQLSSFRIFPLDPLEFLEPWLCQRDEIGTQLQCARCKDACGSHCRGGRKRWIRRPKHAKTTCHTVGLKMPRLSKIGHEMVGKRSPSAVRSSEYITHVYSPVIFTWAFENLPIHLLWMVDPLNTRFSIAIFRLWETPTFCTSSPDC